ncbi:hydroxyisourate hydrolase [Apibacter raozihei]|uniref:hydroxyisourate hydrolase n=1 Tax=Apibacter raozihei TaxID=2500547 RepID=UPI000FE32B53|nr:hydroxyisourate hydrolase [Apibacter raozihei]
MKKKLFLLILCVFTYLSIYSQEQKFQLSTHILDITSGTPASNVLVNLDRLTPDGEWVFINKLYTEANGRINSFLPLFSENGNPGLYRLTFYTESYFKSKNTETFYPYIQIVFEIKDNKHYHVPITLSPYGYSTYRGS